MSMNISDIKIHLLIEEHHISVSYREKVSNERGFYFKEKEDLIYVDGQCEYGEIKSFVETLKYFIEGVHID